MFIFDVPEAVVTPAHIENNVIVRETKNYIPEMLKRSSPLMVVDEKHSYSAVAAGTFRPAPRDYSDAELSAIQPKPKTIRKLR